MPDILVVDDEPAVCTALRMTLEHRGFSVKVAHNGREALRELCAGSAQERQYDAIILDIVMPDIDGWEVLRAIQNNPLWKQIPVVVISGFAHDPRDYTQVTRFNAILVEKREDFVDVVSEVLNRVLAAPVEECPES
jgi:CheY-like chemotaxis protein